MFTNMLLTAALAIGISAQGVRRKLEDLYWLRTQCTVAVAVVGNYIAAQGGSEEYEDSELMTRRGKHVRNLDHVGIYFVGGPTGLIYAAGQGSIFAVNSRDQEVLSFGSLGKRPDQFSKGGDRYGNLVDGPQYLAVGPKGDIFAYDQGTQTVKHFDSKGKFLNSFTSDVIKRKNVTGFAADAQDHVYLSLVGKLDKAEGFVACYSASGHLVRTLGSLGNGVGQFLLDKDNAGTSGPEAIAIGADGKIYVGDSYGAEVEIFDKTGKPLKTLPIEQRNYPGYVIYGLAVDKQGNLYGATETGLFARRRH